jgi:hypothetical protein
MSKIFLENRRIFVHYSKFDWGIIWDTIQAGKNFIWVRTSSLMSPDWTRRSSTDPIRFSCIKNKQILSWPIRVDIRTQLKFSAACIEDIKFYDFFFETSNNYNFVFSFQTSFSRSFLYANYLPRIKFGRLQVAFEFDYLGIW